MQLVINTSIFKRVCASPWDLLRFLETVLRSHQANHGVMQQCSETGRLY